MSLEIEFEIFTPVFVILNKTIIPLSLVGYEHMIADSVLYTSPSIKKLISNVSRIRGIIVNYRIWYMSYLLLENYCTSKSEKLSRKFLELVNMCE